MNMNAGNGIITKLKSYLSLTSVVIILTIILFLMIVIYIYRNSILPFFSSKTYKANHEKVFGSGGDGASEIEILFFSVDWCPYCKTAKPIWNELKTEYQNKKINGYNLVLTEINCTKETPEVDDMINKYNITGYPTIKLLKGNQVIEYDAKVSKSNLEQFLKSVL